MDANGIQGAPSNNSREAMCASVRCHHRQVCLEDRSTHRPRCVACTSKCPRRRHHHHQQNAIKSKLNETTLSGRHKLQVSSVVE